MSTSLVLIAQPVFLLKQGHADTQTQTDTHTDATDHSTNGSATTSDGNKAIVDRRLHSFRCTNQDNYWSLFLSKIWLESMEQFRLLHYQPKYG